MIIIEKGILKSEYVNIGNRLKNKTGDDQFFGFWDGVNYPINLSVVKKSSENLKINDGPIEVCIDQ